SLPAAALVLVPVLRLAADESLVELDDAHELPKLGVLQGRPDAMAHIPSGLERAETHVAPDLPGTHALLRGQHEVDHAKPVPEVNLGVLEDGPGDIGEPIGAPLAAVRALPMPFAGCERVDVRAAAARAIDAIRPAMGDQVRIARFLVRES